MTKTLFAKDKDVAILVAHETYTCIEENSNYSFQRRSFSMYKGRPLVKPMKIVLLEIF